MIHFRNSVKFGYTETTGNHPHSESVASCFDLPNLQPGLSILEPSSWMANLQTSKAMWP